MGGWVTPSDYDVSLGRRRVDRFDHSVNSGLAAGCNMTRELAGTSASLLGHGGEAGPEDLGGYGSGGAGAGAGGVMGEEGSGAEAGTSEAATWPIVSADLYLHQPMFRSFIPGVGVVCEGIGELDSRFRTVGIWQLEGVGLADSTNPAGLVGSARLGANDTGRDKDDPASATASPLPNPPASPALTSRRTKDRLQDKASGRKQSGASESQFHRGIVYYLDEKNKIVGVLLWNATDLVERARELLRAQPRAQPYGQQDTSVRGLKRMVALAPDSWLMVRETPPRPTTLK